ncbi:MAG TPA: hypothetical protein VGM16_04565 [Gammaproteobacteria bacterium]
MRIIRPLLTVLTLCLLVACGGGGSSGPDLQGIWTGTYAPAGSPVPLYALIKDGGPALFYDAQAGFVILMPQTPGDSTLKEPGTLYPTYGFIFTGNHASLPVEFQGADSASAISGSIVLEGAPAAFSLHPVNPLGGTASVVAGVWSGQYVGSQNVSFQVAADGSVISGQDVFGCHFTGKIAPLDAAKDLFSVTLAETGSVAFCVHHLTGFAYQSGTDQLNIDGHAAGTYYYVVADDAAVAFAAEFKVQ